MTTAEKHAKQISLRSKKATLTAMTKELTESNATRLLYYLIGWADMSDSFWDGMAQGLSYVLNQQAMDITKEAK
jgi:hypothetical protein